MKKHGFTIIELLTIMAIIAILTGLVVPAIQNIMGVSPSQKEKAAFETMEQAHIRDNEVSVRTGNTYKILIIPSIQGMSGHPEVVVKSLPPNAHLTTIEKRDYIVWSPEERVEQDVIIITSIGSMKDEVTITMRAD